MSRYIDLYLHIASRCAAFAYKTIFIVICVYIVRNVMLLDEPLEGI